MSADTLVVVLRTHDSTRVADVALPGDMTVQELVQSSVERWKLPADRDYTLECERLGRQILPRDTLAAAGVQAGDELVLYPLLEAGRG